MRHLPLRATILVLTLCGAFFTASATPVLYASPISGILDITGTVTIDANTFNWGPPPPGAETGYGSFTTVSGTDYFSSIAGFSALARDFTWNPAIAGAPPQPALALVGVPVFVTSFLSGFTAPGYGGLKFDLTFIPQSAAPLCTGAELVGQSCRPDPGSLLTLMVLGPGSTLLEFDLNGFFEDSAIDDSRAAGSLHYRAEIGLGVPEILATLPSGSITGTYGTGAPGAVPEPATLLMLVSGLAVVAGRMSRCRGAGSIR